jgi:hypothetical protein
VEHGSPVDRCSWLACASVAPIVVFQEAIKTDEYDPVMDLLGPEFHVTHQARREADGERYATAPAGFSTLSEFYRNHLAPNYA